MSEVHKPQKAPTEKQFAYMFPLAGGLAGLSRTKRDVAPLLRRGWVTTADPPKNGNRYYQWVRVTSDGLRALAAYVDEHGLPEINGGSVRRRVCSDCGSGRHRYVVEDVER